MEPGCNVQASPATPVLVNPPQWSPAMEPGCNQMVGLGDALQQAHP